MISIDDAIKQSKNKENVSVGGSPCFDFGDVVLVKYSKELKYGRAREDAEEVMKQINEKADEGINVPRHLAIKRVIEGDRNVCYVLQQKCPGINCDKISKYGVSFDEMYESFKYILNIPYEHYKKVTSDGCKLLEMAFENKPKNLFYDEKSGFWFIDFHKKGTTKYAFDPNNLDNIAKSFTYLVPSAMSISSEMKSGSKLTSEEIDKKMEVCIPIWAKIFKAKKELIPLFEKYEKFWLYNTFDEFKEYLIKEGIVKSDILDVTIDEYNELCDRLVSDICEEIAIGKLETISRSDLETSFDFFGIYSYFEKSYYNPIKREDYEDYYYYRKDIYEVLFEKFLHAAINRLKQMEPNHYIENILQDMMQRNL